MDGFLALVRLPGGPPVNRAPFAALAEDATLSSLGIGQERKTYADEDLVFVASFSPHAVDSAVRSAPGEPLVYVSGSVQALDRRVVVAALPGQTSDGRLDAFARAMADALAPDGLVTARGLSGSFHGLWRDPLRRQTLFAVDRLASRPIYVCQAVDFLGVSSDIRCLLSLPAVDRTLDLAGLAQFVRFQMILEERTLYQAIKTLSPATLVRVDHASEVLHQNRYWTLGRLSPFRTEAEAVEATAAVFQAATQRVLRNSRKVGLLLSGGIDSRMLLICTDPAVRSTLTACTFGPAGTAESAIARRIARAGGVDWAPVLQAPLDYWAALPGIISTSNGLYSFHHAHTFRAAPELAGVGYDTLLDGWGLDLLFSGSYLPRGSTRFLGRVLYTFRLLQLSDQQAVADYLRRSLDKQGGVFERSMLSESVRATWTSGPVDAIRSVVERAAQAGGTPYDWVDYALFGTGVAKFRSYPMLGMIRSYLRERNPLFESDVLELYQQTPYSWRHMGPLFRRAILQLDPDVGRIVNNNVGTHPLAPVSIQALSLNARMLWRGGQIRVQQLCRQAGFSPGPLQASGNYPAPGDLAQLLGKVGSGASAARDLLLTGALADSGLIQVDAIRQAIEDCREGHIESAETLLTLVSLATWFHMFRPRLP